MEDWNESLFLLQHSDGRVRIWHKEHESMDPPCHVSKVQAGGGGVMVWGIFSWHTLGPYYTSWALLLNATAYLSIVADHVHSLYRLQCTHLLMATSSRIMSPCQQSSNHLRLVSWTWQWVHFTQMADSTVIRSQSNRALLGCGGIEDSHHGCAANKSAATAWCYHVNRTKTSEQCFPTPCRIHTSISQNNLWIWCWAHALNFFDRPWWGLLWVEPVLLKNRCVVLATMMLLSFRVLAIFL